MDKLDIFEMPMDTKIITTIEELQRFYFRAFDIGALEQFRGMTDQPNVGPDLDALIQGDIV